MIKYKSETEIQANCYQWFRNLHPQLRGLLYAVPNGGRRTKREAAIMKATGTVAGIPDMQFHYLKLTHFFELKLGDGNPSKEQIFIHEQLRKQGFKVYIIRRPAEFRTIINLILTPIGKKSNYLWELPKKVQRLQERKQR